MDYRGFGSRYLLAAVLALVLGGCGSVELRPADGAINVIDNNFVESNDTEVVYTETPWQTFAAGEYHAA